jgi:hypothetical protein
MQTGSQACLNVEGQNWNCRQHFVLVPTHRNLERYFQRPKPRHTLTDGDISFLPGSLLSLCEARLKWNASYALLDFSVSLIVYFDGISWLALFSHFLTTRMFVELCADLRVANASADFIHILYWRVGHMSIPTEYEHSALKWASKILKLFSRKPL